MNNEQIAKFISDNRNTKLVGKLFQANDNRDRKVFTKFLMKIRECIRLQGMIKETEQKIAYHSQEIKEAKEIKNYYKQQLRRLKDRQGGKNE